jgi:hypothetical protein
VNMLLVLGENVVAVDRAVFRPGQLSCWNFAFGWSFPFAGTPKPNFFRISLCHQCVFHTHAEQQP